MSGPSFLFYIYHAFSSSFPFLSWDELSTLGWDPPLMSQVAVLLRSCVTTNHRVAYLFSPFSCFFFPSLLLFSHFSLSSLSDLELGFFSFYRPYLFNFFFYRKCFFLCAIKDVIHIRDRATNLYDWEKVRVFKIWREFKFQSLTQMFKETEKRIKESLWSSKKMFSCVSLIIRELIFLDFGKKKTFLSPLCLQSRLSSSRPSLYIVTPMTFIKCRNLGIWNSFPTICLFLRKSRERVEDLTLFLCRRRVTWARQKCETVESDWSIRSLSLFYFRTWPFSNLLD